MTETFLTFKRMIKQHKLIVMSSKIINFFLYIFNDTISFFLGNKYLNSWKKENE